MAIRKIILTLLVLASPFMISTTQAAGMGMGPPAPCGGPFPPCPIPLDSGVLLLLLAGLAYGGYTIFNSFKKNPA